MPILDVVEQSLRDFRPKTHRQFVLLNIARRFDDRARLAQYLLLAERHPKNVLLEAARLAERRAPERKQHPADVFFELLAQWEREAPQ